MASGSGAEVGVGCGGDVVFGPVAEVAVGSGGELGDVRGGDVGWCGETGGTEIVSDFN